MTSIETTAVSVSRSLPIGAPPSVLTSDKVTLIAQHVAASDLTGLDMNADNDTLVSLPADFTFPSSTSGLLLSVSLDAMTFHWLSLNTTGIIYNLAHRNISVSGPLRRGGVPTGIPLAAQQKFKIVSLSIFFCLLISNPLLPQLTASKSHFWFSAPPPLHAQVSLRAWCMVFP